jgi:aryl-phospho-beta-D-glucosidase BglC (GH1 family)
LASVQAQPASTPNSDVPAARLDLLTRGVNLGNWFSQGPVNARYQHDRLENWILPSEFAALHAAGFRHVRFPVEFEMVFDPAHPDVLRPEFLGDFDAALDHILGSGLAVIVDFHAREDTKMRLNTDDAFIGQMAGLWGAMARHLAGRDPERVFLETMNEPAGGMSLERWMSVQEQLFAAMRTGAPRHTIIVTADKWSGIDELLKIAPFADRNVVYNFHFYEPTTFTHQGAVWMPAEKLISGLEYPIHPSNRDAVIADLGQREASAGFGGGRPPQNYAQAETKVWNYTADRAFVVARIALAQQWGRKHGVPLTCNEFGVIVKAPAASRYRWLRDVREACEADGIGWNMWDYCGAFRLASGDQPGQRTLDPGVLAALGLR